jgi:hypothetical protein
VAWQRISEEMAALWDAADRAELAAEVDDRAEAELARLRLSDRLAVSTEPISVQVADQWVRGTVVHAAGELLALDAGEGRHWLIPMSGIIAVTGLGEAAREPGSEGEVASRYGLRSALRALTREPASVRVLTRADPLIGVVVAVGADHLLLQRSAARGPIAVPLSAVAAVELLPQSLTDPRAT